MESNTVFYWVWFLIIGAVIGWLAGFIVRGRGFGVIGDIVVGVAGSALGGWMAGILGLYSGNSLEAFLIALVGAVVLVGVTRLIVRNG